MQNLNHLTKNMGTHSLSKLPEARFPNADQIVHERAVARRTESKVEILLVNPPAPDGGIWIRSQHRVGRRSRENMIWPQVSLAQLAALLAPDYTVEVIDAIATRMGWIEFETLLRERKPRYYLTQVSAPTLTNDMRGVFLARSMGSITLAFGTHVTPMAVETLNAFPSLDYVLRGEPELVLRELVDTLETLEGRWQVTEDSSLIHPKTGHALNNHGFMWKMWSEADPSWKPAWTQRNWSGALQTIRGLVWRKGSEIILNSDRPFIRSLDDLPIPLYHLLPHHRHHAPLIKGPYAFIVTSRGCPAGCIYCIKHVSYQYGVRLRSPQKLIEEIKVLLNLGVRHIQMYSDLFTVSREQVMGLCQAIIDQNLTFTWSCNSRIDYVDEEMLIMMGKAGCDVIAWGIESGSETILKRARKGYRIDQVNQALCWARKAGIMNWGYFIIGLPGETVDTIKETIRFAKKIPLDIALFHVAAPYPGTPFFFEVVENGWFRPGTNWEEVDMDQATVLDYPDLKAEDMLYWQRRAFREWALRPAPVLTFLKSMNTWKGFVSAVNIGLQTLGWVKG
jgi:radical SAM superfamily enzyme YgiQ (UPF0313 family)